MLRGAGVGGELGERGDRVGGQFAAARADGRAGQRVGVPRAVDATKHSLTLPPAASRPGLPGTRRAPECPCDHLLAIERERQLVDRARPYRAQFGRVVLRLDLLQCLG